MCKLNDKNFEETIKAKDLVLVDFYATWCGPCKMQSEVLEKISVSRSANCEIVKVDVDEAEELAVKYEIDAIPTLIIFKKGVLMQKSVGFVTEQEILSMIENIREKTE